MKVRPPNSIRAFLRKFCFYCPLFRLHRRKECQCKIIYGTW